MKMRMVLSVCARCLGVALLAQSPNALAQEAGPELLPAVLEPRPAGSNSDPLATAPPVAEIPAAGSTDGSLGIYGSVDYLLWWVKKGPADVPLVTSGNPADTNPGALGQPGTQVLFPTDRLGYGTFSGLRLNLGALVTENLGIEGSFFFLEQKSVQYAAQSGAAGSPLLAHPIFATEVPLGGGAFGPGQELAEQISNPTNPAFAGGTSISSHTRLSGWDVNAAWNGLSNSSMNRVFLAGFRALDLNEDQYQTLSAFGSGFLGQPIPAGSQLTVTDRFQTVNHFYGGQ